VAGIARGVAAREASTLLSDDDDFGQAHTLVNDVMEDAARDRLVESVSSILSGLRREEVLQRAFDYWRHTVKAVGDHIESSAPRREGAERRLEVSVREGEVLVDRAHAG
jgi:catalase